MTLITPNLRKCVLTLHIIFSIGWIGAVAAFLVLSLSGLTSRDGEVVRSVYISMDLDQQILQSFQ